MTVSAIARSDLAALTTARLAESDFRVGRAISQITTISTRNFLLLFIVNVVTVLPVLLLIKGAGPLGWFLFLMLSTVSQAMIMHAAFQGMHGHRVHLSESLGVGLQRFFPIIGLALVIMIAVGLGFALLLGALAVMIPPTMYIAGGVIFGALGGLAVLIVIAVGLGGMAVCVLEQRGPLASLARSWQLTGGHRWKVLGLMLLLTVISTVTTPLIEMVLAAAGGVMLATIGGLIWTGISVRSSPSP